MEIVCFFSEHLPLLSCRNGHQNWLLLIHQRFHSLNITTITDPWWWIYPAIPISCEALPGGRGCSLGGKSCDCESDSRKGWGVSEGCFWGAPWRCRACTGRATLPLPTATSTPTLASSQNMLFEWMEMAGRYLRKEKCCTTAVQSQFEQTKDLS